MLRNPFTLIENFRLVTILPPQPSHLLHHLLYHLATPSSTTQSDAPSYAWPLLQRLES